MGWWQVDADTLAGSRFVVSPLTETMAGLLTLAQGTAAHPGERAWLDAHLPAYRRRLAADPIDALLLHAALGHHWIADFLVPAPDGPADFADELQRVRTTPAETVHADLAVSLGGPPPAALERPDLAERAAGLLEWVWRETISPSWPRRRRVIEADIVARSERLSQGGWSAALEELRPGMVRWLGEGRLQINTNDRPPRDISGARLRFVPVTPTCGWVSWQLPHRYAVVYPCWGPLADAGRPPVPDALARLLGRARAGVLLLLASPKSTTQLVALTGQGLGSVGRHLKVLLDARLVRRQRVGRTVLYVRTELGKSLVEGRHDI